MLAGGLGVFICLVFIFFWNYFYTLSNPLSNEYVSFFSFKSEHFLLFKNDAFRSIIIILLCFIILFFHENFYKNITLILLIFLILFDLWDVNKRYLNNDDFVQKSKMENPYEFPANDSEIKLDTTIFRVLMLMKDFQVQIHLIFFIV